MLKSINIARLLSWFRRLAGETVPSIVYSPFDLCMYFDLNFKLFFLKKLVQFQIKLRENWIHLVPYWSRAMVGYLKIFLINKKKLTLYFLFKKIIIFETWFCGFYICAIRFISALISRKYLIIKKATSVGVLFVWHINIWIPWSFSSSFNRNCWIPAGKIGKSTKKSCG